MQKTILIVDDEPALREALSNLLDLTNSNYKVLLASGAHEALDVLEKTPVDLVISDLRMPQGDGVYLIQHLAERIAKGLHFAFMTGYSDLTREEAMRLGAKEIFYKPFNLNALQEYLKKSLETSN